MRKKSSSPAGSGRGRHQWRLASAASPYSHRALANSTIRIPFFAARPIKTDRHRIPGKTRRRQDADHPGVCRAVRLSVPGGALRQLDNSRPGPVIGAVGILGSVAAIVVASLTLDLYAQIGMIAIERLAFLDKLAFLEKHAFQIAGDPRVNFAEAGGPLRRVDFNGIFLAITVARLAILELADRRQ